MKSTAFFSPDERQQILIRLLKTLESDQRVAGAVLVGSGSTGFLDARSDIDLSIVLHNPEDVEPLFAEWRTRIQEVTPVLSRFETRYAANNLLHGFLTTRFLEIDMGVVHLGILHAMRGKWTVVFDRSGKIEEILARTWSNRKQPDTTSRYKGILDSIWYPITHTAICAERGQSLRALHYLEAVRNAAVEIAGLRLGLETRNFREVDRFPADFRLTFPHTIASEVSMEEILRALKATVALFFREAKRFEKENRLLGAATLERGMRRYLSFFRPQTPDGPLT